MEAGWINDYNGWIQDDNPDLYRKEDHLKEFNIGVWRGVKNEILTTNSQNPSPVLKEWDNNVVQPPLSCLTLSNVQKTGKPRYRTHSDNDPLCDVSNSASVNFSVNRLSLDNVQTGISAELEEICSSGSPVNSCDSFNSENRLIPKRVTGAAENLSDARINHSLIPPLNSAIASASHLSSQEQKVSSQIHNTSIENTTMMGNLTLDHRRSNNTPLSPQNEVVCPHCNYQNSHGLCCPWWKYSNNEAQDIQNVTPGKVLGNHLWIPSTANVGQMPSTADRPRRPILKSRQSVETENSMGCSRTAGNHESLFASSLMSETQKLPHYLQSAHSHRINTRHEDFQRTSSSISFSTKTVGARSDITGQRNSKKKCPPNYFTSADKTYFEFFRDYKLPVTLSYSQQMQAEAAIGLRSQLTQTEENPFKHLPIHCLKGVLDGEINAHDLGLYWQWLSDVVATSAINAMLIAFVNKFPDLFSSWKQPTEECHPSARLIEHICHILLLIFGDVSRLTSNDRQNNFIKAFNRAVKGGRNPAPLNRTLVAVALTPLLGQDPLLLEKVLCAIPRYKMSFSQLFGSYGTGNGEFTEPSGLAVLRDGRLAVVDTNQHRIMIFKDDRHLDLCFSSDEDAMQADKLSRLEMDHQNHNVRNVVTRNRRWNGYLMYPNRAAVDPNTGHLVLTERAPHPQVQVFTETGRFVRRFGEGYLENPRGLCVDSDSRIIVVECKIMRVTIWSNYQHESDFIASDLGFPNSVAADNRRRLYITDNEAHCVRIFSYSGVPLGSVGGPGLTNFPVAVRLRPCDGAICVFDNHNNFNMTVFTSEGALLEARESEIKHAQIHDVQLRPSDGAVIQAGKDYRVYVYKPYPYYLRGRDQRSPLAVYPPS